MQERSEAQTDGEVGRLVAVWRYPVKSMAGERLNESEVGWHGVAGDRRWAFVRDGHERSGFPWLTIRERSDMAQFVPSLTDPGRPDRSPTTVRTPAGNELAVVDPALAAELGGGVRAIKLDRGSFDAFPLSLVTTQALAGLGALVGGALDVRRFRPNLVVEARGGAGFPEDAWIGCVLRIGGVRVRVDAHDGRCPVIDVDPATTERDPSVLRTLARERRGRLAVYGSIVQPGRLAVGDPVVLEG